ncbi:hypothetical protein ACFFQW_01920 [Umezawaea endophytica]|uniref:Uncharacterized protein n=1 Tax=Umezawaea endophytica TaxID=1654476 RepID=A0A9X2VJ26_9PSEU|nr:hypothetical protein [Umezawaea endophytica]MCS7477007.1 hypothetical protein [Umezawaea endophytica]
MDTRLALLTGLDVLELVIPTSRGHPRRGSGTSSPRTPPIAVLT